MPAGLAFAIALALAAAHGHAQSQAEWDDQAVAEAVEKAKSNLWSQWDSGEGHWPEKGSPGSRTDGVWEPNYGGQTALCLYALLAAGEKPQDPRVKKTLEWLSKLTIHGVYARSVRANVWGRLGPNSKYRRNLADDVQWLVRSAYRGIKRYPDGTYPYLGASPGVADPGKERRGNWDNSNSQMAVLGVWAGARSGIEVPEEYWRLVEKHWTDDQRPDGGWDYSQPPRNKMPNRGYGSMTAAGVATLLICGDKLYAKEFIRCRATTDRPAVLNGLKWLEDNFSADGNPGLRSTGLDAYYLYCVERVGLASGRKYFGNKDWYKEAARVVLHQQKENGAIGDVVETSFSLLFLARGRRPVLFNKLQYKGTWNSRPRDLANLTGWLSHELEGELNWQVVHMNVPVSELHDAPVLYISGAGQPEFGDDVAAKLKEFVEQGGLILSETACNQATFDQAMRKLYAKMFPQYEMAVIPRSHPIYRLHFKANRAPVLHGISNGVRLLVVHSPSDLSRNWQLNLHALQPGSFQLAANLYLYLTDKGPGRSRGASHWPAEKPFEPAGAVKVAIVRHAGNWNPEPLAWPRLAILMGARHGIRVELSDPTAPSDLDPAAWPLAALTGTGELKLDEGQVRALRGYVEGGGTLLVDAAGSDEAFADSAEALLAKVMPGKEMRLIPADHPMYARDDLPVRKVAYRPAMRAALPGADWPRLRGLWRGDRLAIVFSREDLTAGLVGYPLWGLKSYEPESVFEIVRNIVLYATPGAGKPIPAAQPGNQGGNP